jgi:hypothetical protein
VGVPLFHEFAWPGRISFRAFHADSRTHGLNAKAMTPSLRPLSAPPGLEVQLPRLMNQVSQVAGQSGASQPTTAQLVSGVRAFVLLHDRTTNRRLDGTCTEYAYDPFDGIQRVSPA